MKIKLYIMSDKIMYFLNYLLNNSLDNTMTHKHFAILVYKNKIYDYGSNNNRTYYNINNRKFFFPTTHAEMNILLNLLKDNITKKQFDMYIIRSKNNEYLFSKPCKNCIDFIIKSGLIKNIIYTTGCDKIYEKLKVKKIDTNNNFKISSGWNKFVK